MARGKCSCLSIVLPILLSPSLIFSQAPAPAPARPPRFVPPARIVSFTAQPETVQAGQPVTLIWATENPGGLTISPDIGRVSARGARQVNPLTTTTYTLTVGGPNNTSVNQSVTVTVAGAAPATSSVEAPPKDPRMPDGKPDFTGVYGFAGVRGATPPTLKPGAEKFKIVRGPNEIRGNTTLGPDCVPLGVPQSFVTPYPFQIVQRPKFILLVFEYPNTFRFIPTDGRPHPPDPDPTWMGDSVGHWDGDTLVVDAVGFNDKTEVSGYMHTESLHVVERYRRVETGLQYDVTVDDPNVFARPWTLPTRILPSRPDLERVDEYVCENKVDYGKYFEKK
jgi:hypothetical protein